MVGKVTTDDAQMLVIVPWDAKWWYRSISAVEIRYIVKV